MTDIQGGSLVRWADAIRDRPDARVSLDEVFVVKRVRANGRCDLVDTRGAELFNIPLNHLQSVNFEDLPRPSPYRRKGFPRGYSQTE